MDWSVIQAQRRIGITTYFAEDSFPGLRIRQLLFESVIPIYDLRSLDRRERIKQIVHVEPHLEILSLVARPRSSSSASSCSGLWA